MHPMSPTVYKILLHGPTIIAHALLPIGQLSEEAAEARNKHFRVYKERFSRKCSREACNMDIINRLLLSSDPLLTNVRPVPRKKSKPFLKETLDMLLPTDPTPRGDISIDENIDSEDGIDSLDEET